MSQNNGTSRRNDIPRPRLEITTPAVRNPGVTVELEPGEVSAVVVEENSK